MRKVYIIDGYNLLHASPDLKRTLGSFGMDRARADLLQALSRFALRGGIDCIVVFDGATSDTAPGVRVISSRSRSADDLIREHARSAGRSLVVVSSDLEIISTARTNLATIIPSKRFAAELDLSPQRDEAPRAGARPNRLDELRETSEKPKPSEDDLDEWRRLFGV
jgi:predicted RNA-binding protein with PIN domain